VLQAGNNDGPRSSLGHDAVANSDPGDSADGNGRQHAVDLCFAATRDALNADVLLPDPTGRRRHVRALRQRLQSLDQSSDTVRGAAHVQRRLQTVHVHSALLVLLVRLAGRPCHSR